MNINRNNYEEYFILYLDNELTGEDRRGVERFADSHPDLKLELNLLLQSKLEPEHITFENKEQLRKTAAFEKFDTNLEHSLLLYIDNELSTDERIELELYLKSNPLAMSQFDLLNRTRLQPEVIPFADKQSLYRQEEKRRVIPMKWRRLAAAAVLLLGITTVGSLLIMNNDTDNGDGTTSFTTPATSPGTTGTHTTNIAIVKEETGKATPANILAEEASVVFDKTASQKQIAAISTGKMNSSGTDANSTKEDPSVGTNNLPAPDENPYVNRISRADIAEVDLDIPPIKTLTSDAQISNRMAVTPAMHQPLYTSNTSDQTDEDVRQKGKKGGFRGFVRKITRTFEKNTDFEATDGDDRLLVAGLAIKL